MTTRLQLTFFDSPASLHVNFIEDRLQAWSYIAEVTADRFECLPEDVHCDECPEGGDDLVTVNGEAVGRISLTVIQQCDCVHTN